MASVENTDKGQDRDKQGLGNPEKKASQPKSCEESEDFFLKSP